MLPRWLPSHRHVGWKVSNVDAWMWWMLYSELRDDDIDDVASFSLYYYYEMTSWAVGAENASMKMSMMQMPTRQ